MSALRGFLQADDGKVQSRLAHRVVTIDAETWEGAIRVVMHADGSFRVLIGDKGDPSHEIARGNVDKME